MKTVFLFGERRARRVAEIKAEHAARDERIRALWPTHTIHEIAAVVGLTAQNVRAQATLRLGLPGRPLDEIPTDGDAV